MGGFERERGRGLLLGRLLFPRPYTSSTRRTDRQGEEEEKVALNGGEEEERETPPAGDLGGRPEGPPAPLSLSLSLSPLFSQLRRMRRRRRRRRRQRNVRYVGCWPGIRQCTSGGSEACFRNVYNKFISFRVLFPRQSFFPLSPPPC